MSQEIIDNGFFKGQILVKRKAKEADIRLWMNKDILNALDVKEEDLEVNVLIPVFFQEKIFIF